MPSFPSIAYLTAGGAGMYCGSCMRDNTLAAHLIKLGCPVQLIPLYTPIRTDEEDVSVDRLFFGGINVYLRHKLPWLGRLPGWLVRWLDHPALVGRVASWAVRTSGRQLGDLTVSMLKGESGSQQSEVHRLVDWLDTQVRPDLVNLSNILIAGCIPALKRRLNVPLLVTLQGDDLFLEELVEPYKSQAADEIRRLARLVDGFLVFSHYYARHMAEYLDAPLDKFHIVPMGVALDDFRREPAGRPTGAPPTVGYFARLCPAKGLHVLVDAFLLLRDMPGTQQARLHVAGWLSAADRDYAQEQFARVARAVGPEAARHAGVLDRQAKIEFFRSIDVLSVPTVYREPKGIFVLEALASGVPVVQPAHGAFPELIEATEGGQLFAPNDPRALAEALHSLLTNPRQREDLARRGRQRVLDHFSAERMALATLDVYRTVTAASHSAMKSV